jgi:PAS domain S-box-containing protein
MPQTAPPDAAVLLQALPLAVWQLDAQGRVAWCNAAAVTLMPQDAGQDFVDLWREPAAACALLQATDALAELTHVRSGRRYAVHARALADAGHVLSLQALPEVAADSDVMLAGPSNELGSQLALAVELAGISIWRHDLKNNRMHYSPHGWRSLGLAPRPEGMTLEETRSLVHPDDLPRVVASAEAAMHGNAPVDVQARYRHADGSWRDMMLRRTVVRDAQGQPVAFLGVGLDVTEQQAQRRLAEALSRRFESVTRAAGIGYWQFEHGQTHVNWSEELRRMLGVGSSAPLPLARQWVEQLVHPEDRAPLRSAMQRWLRSGEESLKLSFRAQRPDGELRHLFSHSQLASGAGTSGGKLLFGVVIDLTEQHRAEQALRESAAQSQAKSKFLARMSHELRTPLNAVLGFTQLLAAEEDGGDAASAGRQRRLAHIHSAGQHLLTLINDVLDLSGLESGELRIALVPVPLGQALAQTLPMLAGLQRQTQVRFEHGPLSGHVMADPTRLRQVLLNLLSNAFKYNRPGGWVRVHSEPRGQQVLLRVADGGHGMNAEQLSRLFEPFNRLGAEAGSVEGSGIGLAIVKALVQRMGGSLAARSVPGEGTVFDLLLDAAKESPAAANEPTPQAVRAEAAAAVAADTTKRQRRLLYIEDNPVNALIIGELVARRNDLALHVAVDGSSGLAQARSLQPELILLDMQLPDFDGYEVLRRLRADPATASIPCIAVSANAMPEDIGRALAAGMADYWTKPLDFKAFMAALEMLFGKA